MRKTWNDYANSLDYVRAINEDLVKNVRLALRVLYEIETHSCIHLPVDR